MTPIIQAFSVASGVARAGLGIMGAGDKKRRNERKIEQAYFTAGDDLNRRQHDVHQDSLESLNGRGLLTPGGGRTALDKDPPNLYANAYMSKGEGYRPGANDTSTRSARRRDGAPTVAGAPDPNWTAATGGSPGSLNTVAGGAQRQLAGEFYRENFDLDQARQQALADNDTTAMDDTVASIAGGVKTGVQTFQMTSAIQGAFGIDPLNPTLSLSGPISTQARPATSFDGTSNGGQPNHDFNVTGTSRRRTT